MSEARSRIDTSAYTLDLTGREGFLSWAEVFGDDRPVEFEVGSGKGLFLANAATARPNRNFLGVELAKKYARLRGGARRQAGADQRPYLPRRRQGVSRPARRAVKSSGGSRLFSGPVVEGTP